MVLANEPRTYGGWRPPFAHGIGKFSFATTLAGLGVLGLFSVLAQSNFKAALTVLLLGAVVLVPTALRNSHGLSLGTRLGGWFAYRLGRARGANHYRSGPLSLVPGGQALLPGLAMDSDVYEARDSWGRPFAMIHYRALDHYVAVLTCSSRGGDLVDETTVDAWVANWGDYQRKMSLEPSLLGYQVVVESAPDSGERVRRTVDAQYSPNASPLSQAVMDRVKAKASDPGATGNVALSTWIAFTYDAASSLRKRERTPQEMAVLIGQRLPQLSDWAISTGAGANRPLTHRELAELVRMAYDPAVRPAIDRARIDHANGTGPGSGLTWAQAGPTAHDAQWDHYAHDGAFSCSFLMGEAPRGTILSTVLKDLVRPHRSIDVKRITMIYRPHGPAEAAALVEADSRSANSGRASARSDKSRREAEAVAAARTAKEEAGGAGLTLFGIAATATVMRTFDADRDSERLLVARQALNNLAAPTRIALRPASSSQDSAFLATLPIGVILPAHHRSLGGNKTKGI